MSVSEKLRVAKGLLSVKQIAELLGSHRQTVYKWTAEGRIPFVRVGSRVKFDGSLVADWVEARSL